MAYAPSIRTEHEYSWQDLPRARCLACAIKALTAANTPPPPPQSRQRPRPKSAPPRLYNKGQKARKSDYRPSTSMSTRRSLKPQISKSPRVSPNTSSEGACATASQSPTISLNSSREGPKSPVVKSSNKKTTRVRSSLPTMSTPRPSTSVKKSLSFSPDTKDDENDSPPKPKGIRGGGRRRKAQLALLNGDEALQDDPRHAYYVLIHEEGKSGKPTASVRPIMCDENEAESSQVEHASAEKRPIQSAVSENSPVQIAGEEKTPLECTTPQQIQVHRAIEENVPVVFAMVEKKPVEPVGVQKTSERHGNADQRIEQSTVKENGEIVKATETPHEAEDVNIVKKVTSELHIGNQSLNGMPSEHCAITRVLVPENSLPDEKPPRISNGDSNSPNLSAEIVTVDLNKVPENAAPDEKPSPISHNNIKNPLKVAEEKPLERDWSRPKPIRGRRKKPAKADMNGNEPSATEGKGEFTSKQQMASNQKQTHLLTNCDS